MIIVLSLYDVLLSCVDIILFSVFYLFWLVACDSFVKWYQNFMKIVNRKNGVVISAYLTIYHLSKRKNPNIFPLCFLSHVLFGIS